MIRRDKRNLGKRVRVTAGVFQGQEGVIRGFRGFCDMRNRVNIPWVDVGLPKGIFPVRGDYLEYVGKPLIDVLFPEDQEETR